MNPLSLSTLESHLETKGALKNDALFKLLVQLVGDPRFDMEEASSARLSKLFLKMYDPQIKSDRDMWPLQEKIFQHVNIWKMDNNQWVFDLVFKSICQENDLLFNSLTTHPNCPPLSEISGHFHRSNVEKQTTFNLAQWATYMSYSKGSPKVEKTALSALKWMGDKGYDFNAPPKDAHSDYPLSLARSKETLDLLLHYGARVDALNPHTQKTAIEEMFSILRGQHYTVSLGYIPEMIAALRENLTRGRYSKNQIEPYWEAITSDFADFFSDLTKSNTPQLQVVADFIAWANELELPLGKDSRYAKTFWGQWAYQLTQKENLYIFKWADQHYLKTEKRKWLAESYEGIRDGVWAALSESRNASINNPSHPISKRHLEAYMASDEKAFWQGFAPAFEKLGFPKAFKYIGWFNRAAPLDVQQQWQDLTLKVFFSKNTEAVRYANNSAWAWKGEETFEAPLLKRLEKALYPQENLSQWFTQILWYCHMRAGEKPSALLQKTLDIIQEENISIHWEDFHVQKTKHVVNEKNEKQSLIEKLEIQQTSVFESKPSMRKPRL